VGFVRKSGFEYSIEETFKHLNNRRILCSNDKTALKCARNCTGALKMTELKMHDMKITDQVERCETDDAKVQLTN